MASDAAFLFLLPFAAVAALYGMACVYALFVVLPQHIILHFWRKRHPRRVRRRGLSATYSYDCEAFRQLERRSAD